MVADYSQYPLKKTVSFALVVVLAMNTFGYYGIFLGLQYKHGVAITSKLDGGHYDAAQTVTIKVALAVPYMYDDADFKRAEGLFQHEGQFYRLVKQKYTSDTLTIVCIPDFEARRINQTMSVYAMTFGDDDDSRRKASTVSISFIKEYLPEAVSIHALSDGWYRVICGDRSSANVISSFEAPITQPPDHVALT